MTHTSATLAVDAAQSDTATMVRQIAHELRQPLSTIESIAYYLDLILPRDDPRARTQLERLQKLVDQSNWIVSNAVHYVQASPAVPQSLDIGEVVGTAASECGIGPLFRYDSDQLELVRIDPSQAVHLFRNLLTFFRNIATLEHPVRLWLGRGPATVDVHLSTTAPGHSLHDVYPLFEPFSPGLPAGSGLSLASVRRIVEAHAGQVEIEADAADGVSVTLTFPN
jgi:signal transduction histidine kinase